MCQLSFDNLPPLPQAPSPSPSAFSSGGSCHAAVPSLSPRQPSPGNAKKRISPSLAKRQQRIKQQKPAGMAGFLVCTAKQAAEKIFRLPILCRTIGNRKTGTPVFPHSSPKVKAPQRKENFLLRRVTQSPPGKSRGTVDKRQTTAAPYCLILQNKARLGGEGEPFVR